jgi:hypothetical protein
MEEIDAFREGSITSKSSSNIRAGRAFTRKTSGISSARSCRTLRDGSFGGPPRHFVPGYDRAVPLGRDAFSGPLNSGSTLRLLGRRECQETKVGSSHNLNLLAGPHSDSCFPFPLSPPDAANVVSQTHNYQTDHNHHRGRARQGRDEPILSLACPPLLS